MFRKKFIFSFLLISLLLAGGFYTYYKVMKVDNAKQVSKETQGKEVSLSTENNEIDNSMDSKAIEEQIRKEPRKKNKFYSVYVVADSREGGSATEFIPEIINPDFNPYDGYNSSTYGDEEVRKGEMFIYIENYRITKEVKDQIKKIAGSKKYQAALEEIKETEEYGTVNGVPLIEK